MRLCREFIGLDFQDKERERGKRPEGQRVEGLTGHNERIDDNGRVVYSMRFFEDAGPSGKKR